MDQQEPSSDPILPSGSAEPSREELSAAPVLEWLDRRVVVYWLITGVFSFLFLTSLLFAAGLFFRQNLPDDPTVLLIVAGILASLYLAWILVAPSLAYARWRFSITDELLLARYGIIFHEEKAIPISRMQHVDLMRGPIERMFGLATLVVYTAGTEGASFRLPGVDMRRAEEIRDQILRARGDDVI